MMSSRTLVPRSLLVLLVSALLTTCGGDSKPSEAALENRFEATADHPYSFRYPSEWVLGEETDGELAIGIQDSVGMVLEPVHPWGGTGAFGDQDAERVEIDDYDGYRLVLEGDGEGDEGKALAYRINAGGLDVTVWFFAREPAAYDEDLFGAIMSTFRLEQDLLAE